MRTYMPPNTNSPSCEGVGAIELHDERTSGPPKRTKDLTTVA